MNIFLVALAMVLGAVSVICAIICWNMGWIPLLILNVVNVFLSAYAVKILVAEGV